MEYQNPIVYADFSDPDVIRVNDNYYMIASSFTNTPGLPILKSQDLVNWKLVNYAVSNVPDESYFESVRHGCGIWAPAIRFHEGTYYILFPMPDEGIYMVKTEDPEGEWSEPVCICKHSGYIDPCPFFDEDGRVYMVFGVAKSRIGFKSVLFMSELNKNLTGLISEPVKVFDGNFNGQETIEGPKLYKKNGYYYIFSPAGGVKQGWQTVLRSKNIYGPYEYKVVLKQGNSAINGPHQGAWVTTQAGEDWFIHFQDVYAAGRIICLEPMTFTGDGWPIIGCKVLGEDFGEAVEHFRYPKGLEDKEKYELQASDDFESDKLGLQWQFNGNHKASFYECDTKNACLYLNSIKKKDSVSNQPNLLLQKWTKKEFEVRSFVDFSKLKDGDEAGIINMGCTYGAVSVRLSNGIYSLISVYGEQTFDKEKALSEDFVKILIPDLTKVGFESVIEFKLKVTSLPSKEYNTDGEYKFPIPLERLDIDYRFKDTDEFVNGLSFTPAAGRWVGAKFGFYICNKLSDNGGKLILKSVRVK